MDHQRTSKIKGLEWKYVPSSRKVCCEKKFDITIVMYGIYTDVLMKTDCLSTMNFFSKRGHERKKNS